MYLFIINFYEFRLIMCVLTLSIVTTWNAVCVCILQAGIYWVTLIDQFAATWVMMLLVILEIIGIVFIYGE